MPFTTLNLGLELTIPTNGTTNWGTTLTNTTWTKISQHNHTGSGDGNQIPAGGITNGAITSAKLDTHIALTHAATLTPSGTTQTIDFDNGNIQTLDLGSATGTVILTLSNPQQGARYLLFVIQGSPARDLTFPASVKWPQGQQIILSTANNAVDYIDMYYDGASYQVLGWDLNLS